MEWVRVKREREAGLYGRSEDRTGRPGSDELEERARKRPRRRPFVECRKEEIGQLVLLISAYNMKHHSRVFRYYPLCATRRERERERDVEGGKQPDGERRDQKRRKGDIQRERNI